MLQDLVGYLDVVSFRTVSGWAYDPASPLRKVEVAVRVNGGFTGTARADRFRQDLFTLSLGDGRHGFSFPIPENVTSVDEVNVVFIDSGQPLIQPAGPMIDHATNRPVPDDWRREDGTFLFPSLFILGAAKSGTTSLHQYLSQCAALCASNPKEPYYFESEWERGPAFYFNRYFPTWRGQAVVTEARHRNLYLPWIAQRIAQHNPEARLVAILREPVERALSHWWHWYASSLDPLSFREAVAEDIRRIEADRDVPEAVQFARYQEAILADQDGWHRTYQRESKLRTYVDSGYYLDQIERFLQYFPRERMHIVLMDDLIASPAKTVADILQFAGLDPSLVEGIAFPVLNASPEGKWDQVDEQTLCRLADHYRPHNARLEQFLGRSLSPWDC